jgi:hypothetical protein
VSGKLAEKPVEPSKTVERRQTVGTCFQLFEITEENVKTVPAKVTLIDNREEALKIGDGKYVGLAGKIGDGKYVGLALKTVACASLSASSIRTIPLKSTAIYFLAILNTVWVGVNEREADLEAEYVGQRRLNRNHDCVVDRELQFPEIAKLAEGNSPENTQLVSLNLLALLLILPLVMRPISTVLPQKMQELTVIPKLFSYDPKTPIVFVLS